MMKLKDFKYLFYLFFFTLCVEGQNIVYGVVSDSTNNALLENVKIVDTNGLVIDNTDTYGYYSYSTSKDFIHIAFVKDGFSLFSKKILFNTQSEVEFNVSLTLIKRDLKEISVFDKKEDVFDSSFLNDVSDYSVFSGKKNEVIVSENKSSKGLNSARHMYNKTVSLNITQTDETGLQLNIGGRGLNPRRTSNFNVRQNGYDIAPDPLGYPESYYTPPFESLENIQLIRGAASLQYGTQFGGMINFNIKKPTKNKLIDLTTINTFSSYNIFTNFTRISGTNNQFSYSSFFKHMKGDGFRPNSDFVSDNFYAFISYDVDSAMSTSFEITYLKYLAHQPGGLTDEMFNADIFQSNRERNWFEVNWLLYNFKLSYSFSDRTNAIISTYYLDAHRFSVGFRSNRVDQIDSFEERDLIKSDFNNLGLESKIVHEYQVLNKNMVFLIGTKLFYGNNDSEQGPGSNGLDADFNFYSDIYSNYPNQSYYTNPNFNYAFFSENIIYLNKKMTLTPGLRFEYIKTESDGYFRNINTDAAGNVIMNNIINSSDLRERSFLLFGLGYSYQFIPWSEFYSNISQNYRAVTFADINTINPNFIINPDIHDEDGYTFDFGFRGIYKDFISYDLSSFYLFYNNRIGFVQKEINGLVKNEKGNVGDAIILGQEMLINFNISRILNIQSNFKFNYFINLSNLSATYIRSDINGVEGKKLEFVPAINCKTGVQIGYKNIKTDLQYTFMSSQYTDATNSIDGDISGVIGRIPQYSILDFSLSYLFKKYFNLEFGVSNVLDSHYFTTRVTGYPGPGIIPSTPRNYYLSIQYKL